MFIFRIFKKKYRNLLRIHTSADIENNELNENNVQIVNEEERIFELNNHLRLFKCKSITAVLVTLLPLTFADIYFAYYKDICVFNYIDNIQINLRLFLIVFGISQIFIICYFSYAVLILLDDIAINTNNRVVNDNQTICDSLIIDIIHIITKLFINIWNILYIAVGVILYIKFNEICQIEIYHYIIITFTIKLGIFGLIM